MLHYDSQRVNEKQERNKNDVVRNAVDFHVMALKWTIKKSQDASFHFSTKKSLTGYKTFSFSRDKISRRFFSGYWLTVRNSHLR